MLTSNAIHLGFCKIHITIACNRLIGSTFKMTTSNKDIQNYLARITTYVVAALFLFQIMGLAHSGSSQVTVAKLTNILAGNSIVNISERTGFKRYFDPNGTHIFDPGKGFYLTGNWFIDKNTKKLCDWEVNPEKPRCAAVELDGDLIELDYGGDGNVFRTTLIQGNATDPNDNPGINFDPSLELSSSQLQDVIIHPPKKSLPNDLAGFSGGWYGTWYAGRDFAIIVEKLDKQHASLVYAWGPNKSSDSRQTGSIRTTGQIDGSIIKFSLWGESGVLSLHSDGNLKIDWQNEDWSGRSIATRWSNPPWESGLKAQCDDMLLEVNVDNICTQIKTYTSYKAKNPSTLVVALHGDNNNQSYQYEFASRVAQHSKNVVSIGMLRPGYTDNRDRTSDGIRGFAVGDNYDEPRIHQIAKAIIKLKKYYKVNKVILAGHSGGAAITAKLIAIYPNLINHAFIVSCPCHIPSWSADRYKVSKFHRFKDSLEVVSPIEMVDGISSDTKITIIVGKDDDNTKPYLSEEYFNALKDAGKNASYHVIPGEHNVFLYELVLGLVTNEVGGHKALD